MKIKISVFVVLTAIALNCKSQSFPSRSHSDYSIYLDKAMEQLEAGNCEGAQRLYNVYKELSGATSSVVEKRISDCLRNDSNPKEYQVGDDADFVDLDGSKGYKIAYCEGSHGFAIKYDGYSKYSSFEAPSIAELKIIYRNRYRLGIGSIGEYWSTTAAETPENIFTVLKYYTIDFATGEIKKRKDGKAHCINLRIWRF